MADKMDWIFPVWLVGYTRETASIFASLEAAYQWWSEKKERKIWCALATVDPNTIREIRY